MNSLFVDIVCSYIVKDGAAVTEFKENPILKENPKCP